MILIIHFQCRACEGDVSISPVKTDHVSCPNCKSSLQVVMNDSLVNRRIVTNCVSCGHDTFYVQKDFNRTFGLSVVLVGSAISIYFLNQGEPLYAFLALFLMALIDFLVYVKVGDVTVCYACHAVYRGFERNPEHEPFDLKKLEKYGGRDPRIGGTRL